MQKVQRSKRIAGWMKSRKIGNRQKRNKRRSVTRRRRKGVEESYIGLGARKKPEWFGIRVFF